MSKLGGILFTSIPYTVQVCCAAGLLKVRVTLCSQNGPLAPSKPLQQPDAHVNTQQLHICLSWPIQFQTACFCLSFALESTVGWISTLDYDISTNCWPEMFSVAYCTNIVRRKLMLKKERYQQKSVYSHRRAHRLASLLLGYSVWVFGQIHATHSCQSTKNNLGTLE